MPVLVDIERAGVRIDTAALAAQSQRIDKELATRNAQIFELAGEQFNIGSPQQLSRILFDKLQLPALRRNAKTRTASTAADVLEELALTHDLPRLILQWRELMKLKGTYIDALPLLVNPETGRVHTCFNQAVAATGRLSSSDPNLQNIPDSHRARPRDSAGVRRRTGARADFGRLLADRVPRPRAPGGRPGAGRRVSGGRRLPRTDGAEDLRQRQRPRPARPAQHGQDGQLRAALRQDRVHAGEGHRRHAAGGAGVHRRLLRRLPEGARVHRPARSKTRGPPAS